MITLTNQIAVTTTLGATGKTNYDRFEIISVNMDVVNKNITGQCQLIVSAGGQQPIVGNYSIPTTGSAVMTISLPSLPFFGQVALTSTRQAAVQGWVTAAQNNIESGLVSVNVIAGTQATGL